MRWRLVESEGDLAQVTRAARQAGAVAVDTEFMRQSTFHPRVALVQLCFAGAAGEDIAWLIDPLAIADPAPLAEMLDDTGVIKILHSPSEDLEVFQHWLGELPRPLFDTQRAAALLDLGFGLGYRALVEKLLGVDLPKGETRSDWLQRPLTESQCAYAAQDVTYLLPVWQELERRCRQEHKFDWVLSDGADAVAAAASGVGDYHTRIKGAWKLHPRQLAALAALCEWREGTARRRDKPRGWIIDDRTCLALAQSDPASLQELAGIPGLPAPVLRRHGEELLRVLAEQRERAEEELPARLPAPLDASQRQSLQRLKRQRESLAEDLRAAPEALLQTRDLELLLREHGGDAVTAPRHWQGWRAEEVLPPLRRALAEQGT